MRHFAGKLQGITARIALNLHCFWAAATGEVLTSQIDRSMMRRAIDVAQFALAQIQILAAQVELTDSTTSVDIPRPAPPTVDRPVTEPVSDPTHSKPLVVIASKVKVDDWIEYQVKGDTIEWIEIAFHKHAIARDWAKQLELWGSTKEQKSRNNR